MRVEVVEAMPFPDYLREYGVSQSQLKLLAKSPAHLRQYVDHPEPPTDEQKLGTVAHVALFQPDMLMTCCYVKPTVYEDDKGKEKKWNGNATYCREWAASHTDRPILSARHIGEIFAMRDRIRNHPGAALSLKEGIAEVSLFCEDADTGLQLKCRSDWLSGNAIVDLKTCIDASKNGFSKLIARLGYDIQAAYNLDIANTLGLKKEIFIFIAVEKKAPFAVAAYQLKEEAIAVGRSKYRRLLARYQECVSTEKWPGYSSNIEYLDLPKWAMAEEFNATYLEENPEEPALDLSAEQDHGDNE